jgi:hypothetical protein
MKNKSAQELARKSVKSQKKKYGKDYPAEMKRRIQKRWATPPEITLTKDEL